jgi:HEAT repeat protein
MNTTGRLRALVICTFIGFALSVGAVSLAAQESWESDEAAEAYQQAYNLILDEQWEEAASRLASFLEKFQGHAWADGARFWQCYCRAQLGESLEEVFSCYQRFIAEYPESKWKDDAETHMIAAARELARAGVAEYWSFLEAKNVDADREVALSAIMALQTMGNEQALPALMNLLENNPDAAAREQIAFLLSRFESPEAKSLLIGLVLADPSSKIRGKALFWLAQGDAVTADDIQVIEQIVKDDADSKVRESGVFALSQVEGRRGAEALIRLARTHPDPKVREKALFWLAQSDEVTADDIQAIVDIIISDSETKVRQHGVFALSQIEGRRGAEALIDLVRTHPDPNVREKILFWLAQTEQVTAGDIRAIVEIIDSDSEARVREQGVFALSQVEGRLGADALIALARKHPNPEVREKALFWLAQGDEVTAGDIQAIVEIVSSDSDTKVREHGVFALSQIEGCKGVEALVNFARSHNDPRIREKAVFWLVQGGGIESGVVQVADIVKIVLNDSNRKVQESALFALSQIPDGQGVDALAEIAQSHPEPRMRKQAVIMLQRVGDERAQEALLKIIGQEAK